MNSIISCISKENKICYVVGDMNLNIMDHEVHTRTGEFLDSMLSFMMYSCISLPSRLTANSATLIDNIFTNDQEYVLKCGLLFTDITDHFPVFVISDTSCSNISQTHQRDKTILTRNFNETNKTKFTKYQLV
jgi:hypothetical protein